MSPRTLPPLEDGARARPSRIALLALLCVLALGSAWTPVGASEPSDPAPGDPAPAATSAPRRPRWSEEARALAEAIPIQAGGRVKPLITYAGYTLLALNGRKSLKVVEDGEELSLTPTEWLLDVLFFPDVAAHYRVFLVTDDATLDAIGFTREMREKAAKADYEREGAGHATRKKRDRWSFADLAPAFRGLDEQARAASKVASRERSRTQQAVLELYQNVSVYSQLEGSMLLARGRLEVPEALRSRFSGAAQAPFSAVAAELEDLLAILPAHALGQGQEAALSPEQQAAGRMLYDLQQLSGGEDGLALLPPPPGATDGTWHNPYRLVAGAAAQDGSVPPESLALLGGFERVGDALGKPTATLDALRALHDALVAAAQARGEYRKVPLEVTYQRLDPVRWSWVLSMLGLAFALLGLLSLRGGFGRVFRPLAWLTTGSAAAMLVTGIVMRCIIRDRPPVSTLYETVLFISATGMLACFVMEALSRRWLALPVAAVIGTLGLQLAQWFEGLNKQDTMPTLEAVLDTNFWLSTHVTTVTFGYAAGLLAAIVGQVYVLGRVLGIGKQAHETYAAIGRTVYGVVCFGLLLSLLGTILGGIWANDSWGRFWGWDPKENGALMIVLWELIALHARLGGYVGPFGFSMLAIAGGAVVSWSWWGVNQLGVGLHSYGFTEGIQTMLNSIYGWLGAVLVLGLGWRLLSGRKPAGGGGAGA